MRYTKIYVPVTVVDDYDGDGTGRKYLHCADYVTGRMIPIGLVKLDPVTGVETAFTDSEIDNTVTYGNRHLLFKGKGYPDTLNVACTIFNHVDNATVAVSDAYYTSEGMAALIASRLIYVIGYVVDAIATSQSGYYNDAVSQVVFTSAPPSTIWGNVQVVNAGIDVLKTEIVGGSAAPATVPPDAEVQDGEIILPHININL